MGVVIGDVDTFMTHTIRNGDGAEAHVDQQTDRTVLDIMNPDALDAGLLCTAVHLMVQILFCEGEDAILLADPIKGIHV